MIEIRGLTKVFGELKAVDNLSVSVKPGEIFGFLGPNGAGKTTTVKILSGLMHPTEGEVIVGGYNVVTHPIEAKKIMALVPDEPFVYPKLTGVEFMYFVGDLYGVSRSRQKTEIPKLLSMFELDRWKDELLESYSHGMRQKLVLSSVLLREPKVVLLDEPMVGLDPKSARLMKVILKDLAAKGVTIFMCTHILEIAQRLCGRIGIMYEGRMTELGTFEELRARAGKSLSGGTAEVTLEEVFLSLTGGGDFSHL